MKVISYDAVTADLAALSPLVTALDRGGLVCVPHTSGYRLLADLMNEDAVTHLLQAKRRMRHSPSLVFLDSAERFQDLAEDFGSNARQLADAFWPGPLTMLVRPNRQLPRKVIKVLTKANKHLGVRVPSSPLIRYLVSELKRPVVASSANRERRPGESSVAQVRRTFGQHISAMIDAGDLQKSAPSTVIQVNDDMLKLVRPGAINDEDIRSVLAA